MRQTIAMILSAGFLFAQSTAKFEVASVKAAGPVTAGGPMGNQGGPGTKDPGRISYGRITIAQLLMRAYGVVLEQISSPDWIKTEEYTIAAKLPPDTTQAQFQAMLQNLLKDRFLMALHHETREVPVYELQIAKGGPKFKPTADPNVPPAMSGGFSGEVDRDGFPILPAGQAASASTPAVNGVVRTNNFAMGMTMLIHTLSMELAGPRERARIVDKTGLTGKYDFRLEYASTGRGPGAVVPETPSDPGAGPSIFTALEKQLGLKLEKAKAQVDFLVIDHAQKVPTEN